MLKSYLKQIKNLKKVRKDSYKIVELASHFSKWKKFARSGTSPLQDRIPWTLFEAMDFLSNIIKPNFKIFEYGSGGSTIFFLEKGTQLFSVEHDAEWLQLTQNALNQELKSNWSGKCIPPEKDIDYNLSLIGNADLYFSEDERYRGMNFKNYAAEIDCFGNQYFDLVFVDGRARPACIKHSLPKIKIGGYLVLDNADRNYYTESFNEQSLDGNFEKVFDRFGPGPYSHEFWGAKVWKRLK